MIYFVIPLRSKAAAKNWERVTADFNKTIKSCYNQTSPEFKIFVACHDIPTVDFGYDERVKFIQVDIPVPTTTKEMMFDKGYKMYTLMQTVRNEMINCPMHGGGYILPVDADDLISNRIASFFEGRNDGKCYTSKYGWIWNKPSKFLMKAKDLWRTCGSCTVIYYKKDELPDVDFYENTNKYIFQNSHRFLIRYAKSVGKQFGIIPFPTTVYVLGTGENHSSLIGRGVSWKRVVEGLLRIPRYMGKSTQEEFNLAVDKEY